jgi:hypothetical protein
MTAWQRSNVLNRQEKGIGAIPFKRLLMAGGIGGAVAMFTSRLTGFAPGCTGGLLVFALALVVTHPIQGHPLFSYLYRTVKGWMAVAAAHNPAQSATLLAHLLQVQPEDGVLDAETEFNLPTPDTTDEPTPEQWVYLGSFDQADDHTLVIDLDPFQGQKA